MGTALPEVFVGRSRQLEGLEASLAAASEGRGRVVLLIGEPGIGKTRTAEEFSRRARRAGGEVLVGRCYEGDGAPPFWPWVQVLRAYVGARDAPTLRAQLGAAAPDVAAVCPELRTRLPELPASPVLASEVARFRFFEGVTGALVCAAALRPIVLVLDDLQSADKPSLLLLQFLARELRDARLLVVGGLRSSALARDHPLSETLGELVREQVAELLTLPGLTEAEVADLLAQVAGEPPPRQLRATVHAQTEGNPLYVIELARMLAADGGFAAAAVDSPLKMPDTVYLAITKNLRLLSRECLELLRLAALFGREFRLEALTRASGLTPKTVLALLDEAEAARVVDAAPQEPTRRRFAHVLFADALVADLGAGARAALHSWAAEALALDPRASERPTEVAHHWFQAGPAGDPDQAVAWTVRAAERTVRLFAHEETARWYRRALKALDWSPSSAEPRRAELLLGLGEACQRAGEIAEAKQAFAEAAALGRKLGSPEVLTRAALGFAPPLTYATQPEPDAGVVRLLEEAVGAWNGRDSGLHACALARLALALLFDERERTEAISARAIAMARRVGDAPALRAALAASLSSRRTGSDPELQRARASELRRLGEEASDLEALAVARLWRAIHSLETGDARAMHRERVALARLATALHQPVWSWHAQVLRGRCALLDGRFEDAERAIGAAFDSGQATLPHAAQRHFVAAMMVLRVLQGRPGEYAREYRDSFDGHPEPASISPLAWVESERGNAAEARQVLERLAADDFDCLEVDFHWLPAACFLAEACAFLRDEERAARLYERLASVRSRWVVWDGAVPLAPLAYYRALLARTVGRLDEGALLFEDALAAGVRASAGPSMARTRYEYALLLRARGAPGDAERARSLLGEARAAGEAIGMAGLCGKIAALEQPEVSGVDGSGARVFRREGHYWTIAYRSQVVRLRDLRGFLYLAQLLREPGREFHAVDLAALDNGPLSLPLDDPALRVVVGLGDAGEGLDRRARAAYRERLRELAEELADAERRNDLAWLARACEEREALVAELAMAVRGPRAAGHAERARVAVSKAIGVALKRIAESHPALGEHFAATVRRGYFCAYLPDPRHPIDWDA